MDGDKFENVEDVKKIKKGQMWVAWWLPSVSWGNDRIKYEKK